MTEPAVSLDCFWQSRAREADLLTAWLRVCRLTLLYGEAGAGKTTLLQAGVLPHLRRRREDRRPARALVPRMVIPFPERRNARGSLAEVPIFFDAWNGTPLTSLRERVTAALWVSRAATVSRVPPLAESLTQWGEELSVRFFILFDRFEEYLAAPPEQPEIAALTDELVLLLSDPSVPANFLVSLRDDAEPLMDRLRARVSGLREACLRLPPLERSALAVQEPFETQKPVPAQAEAQDTAEGQRARAGDGAEPHEARERAERNGQPTLLWSRRIGQRHLGPPAVNWLGTHVRSSTQVTAESRDASSEIGSESSATVAATEEAERAPAGPEEETAAPAPAAAPKRAARKLTAVKYLTATAACASVLLAAWVTQDIWWPRQPAHLPAETAAGIQPAALPSTIPPAASIGLPKMTLITDPSSSTDADIAADLASIVAADMGIELVVRSDVPFWRDDGAPRVAIARYEELQVAIHTAQQGKDGIDALRVLTPLYTEEIYVIARRDSRLTFIHDLRDARINVGPDGSSRWLAAARLYDRMFGMPMPLENVRALDDDDALTKLVVDKSLDAMLVVAAQPARWLAELPPEMAREIKLLKLDRRHPAGQRAIGAYLPATVRAANYGQWLTEDVPTLATMSFLITSEYTDPAAAERLDSFTRALCRNLSDLRRKGHPKWREVQPGFEVDAGLPVSASAKASFQACLAESGAGTSAVNRR